MTLQSDLREIESKINTSSANNISFNFNEDNLLNAKFDEYVLEVLANDSNHVDYTFEVIFYYGKSEVEGDQFNDIDNAVSYINTQMANLSI